MRNVKLVQDNRITTARYELSLLEKRIVYQLLKEVRSKFVLKKEGNTTLFDDLVIKTTSKSLRVDIREDSVSKIKRAFKSLRLRSFEWQNEYPEDHRLHEWFEVGFINYSKWYSDGSIEFQVSKEILPFYVELTSRFTEYDSLIAMSLRSKWSQRFYEYCCQWRQAGGFVLSVKDLRKRLVLENKYARYNALKEKVIDVAHKELKALYNKGECDVCFEYSEIKNGRSVESLRIKILSREKGTEILSDDDLDYIVRTELHRIFEANKKPGNMAFVGKTMTALRLDLNKMKHCYKRLQTTVLKMPKEEQAKYLRFIIKEDYLD